MNWRRGLVGWAVSFGLEVEGAAGGAHRWELEHFRAWLALGVGCRLLVDHGPLIGSSGVMPQVGVVRLWSPSPARGETGLLVAAEVDPGPVGDGLLAAARAGLDPYAVQRVGLSVGARQEVDPFGRVVSVVPTEVSLTYTPADPGAWVVAAGSGAVAVWDQMAARRRMVVGA